MNIIIDELYLIKPKLIVKPYYEELKIFDWEVENAFPSNDIIWS